MAVHQGGLQFDMFANEDESLVQPAVPPVITAEGWKAAESLAFVAALRRGALADALGVLKGVTVMVAAQVLMESGFTVGRTDSRSSLMADVQLQVIGAAQQGLSGFELRALAAKGRSPVLREANSVSPVDEGQQMGSVEMPVADLALEKARVSLLAFTAGYGDLWRLSGNAKAKDRAQVMADLMGVEKVTQAKAGVNALQAEFFKRAEIGGETLAEKEGNFFKWAKVGSRVVAPEVALREADFVDPFRKSDERVVRDREVAAALGKASLFRLKWVREVLKAAPLNSLEAGLAHRDERMLLADLSYASVLGYPFTDGEVFERLDKHYQDSLALVAETEGVLDEHFSGWREKAAYLKDLLEGEPKIAWKLSRADYLKVQEHRFDDRPLSSDRKDAAKVFPADFWASMHKDRVAEALADGKEVPEAVLADYPDLQAQEGTLAFVDQVAGVHFALSDPQQATVQKYLDVQANARAAGKSVGQFDLFVFDGHPFLGVAAPGSSEWQVGKLEEDGSLSDAKAGDHRYLKGFAFDSRLVHLVPAADFEKKLVQREQARIRWSEQDALAAKATWFAYQGSSSAFPTAVVRQDNRWFRFSESDELAQIGRRAGDAILLDSLVNNSRDWKQGDRVNLSAEGKLIYSGKDAGVERKDAAPVEDLDAEMSDDFIHAGFRIYKTSVRDAEAEGGVCSMWAVQSIDNVAREKLGQRQIGGDRLLSSLLGARAEAEQQAVQSVKNEQLRQKLDAQEAERIAQVEVNQGLSIGERKANSVLDKPSKFPYSAGLGLGSLREAMEVAVAKGCALVAADVSDDVSRRHDQEVMAAGRKRGWILGMSNPDLPAVKNMQAASDRLKADLYSKKEYRLYVSGDTVTGGFFVISKTAFNFAENLQASRAVAQAVPVVPEVPVVPVEVPSVADPYSVSSLAVAMDAAFGETPDFTRLLRATGRFEIISAQEVPDRVNGMRRFSVAATGILDQYEVAAGALTPLGQGEVSVEVAGKVRPALNSQGRPIHWSKEGVRNFWEWFDDSGSVDQEGRPLVMFHGTSADFNAFSLGVTTENHSALGSYSERRLACFAAVDADFSNAFALQEGKNSSGAQVMPVYLRSPRSLDLSRGFQGLDPEEFDLLYPLLRDSKNLWAVNLEPNEIWCLFDEGTVGASSFVSTIKSLGYDGVKMVEKGESGVDSVVWATLYPEHLKSALGNSGNFRGDVDDVRYSAVGHRVLAFVENAKVFLVADNISQSGDDVRGLLLHEVGVHALSLGRQEGSFQAILSGFEQLRDAGNSLVLAAFARVPAVTPTTLVAEEAVGYFVEHHPALPLARQVTDWFRDLVCKVADRVPGADGLALVHWARTLDTDDLVYMASKATRGAVRSLAADKEPKMYHPFMGVPLASTGLFVGKVVDIRDGFVLQNTGIGSQVVHSLAALKSGSLLRCGDLLEVSVGKNGSLLASRDLERQGRG